MLGAIFGQRDGGDLHFPGSPGGVSVCAIMHMSVWGVSGCAPLFVSDTLTHSHSSSTYSCFLYVVYHRCAKPWALRLTETDMSL